MPPQWIEEARGERKKKFRVSPIEVRPRVPLAARCQTFCCVLCGPPCPHPHSSPRNKLIGNLCAQVFFPPIHPSIPSHLHSSRSFSTLFPQHLTRANRRLTPGHPSYRKTVRSLALVLNLLGLQSSPQSAHHPGLRSKLSPTVASLYVEVPPGLSPLQGPCRCRFAVCCCLLLQLLFGISPHKHSILANPTFTTTTTTF